MSATHRPLASHAPLGFNALVTLAAALMALNALATDIMLPALPALGAALDVARENDRQMVVTAYLIGFGLAQFVMGPLSDRYGRRPVLIAGLAIYAVAGALSAMAWDFGWLLAARAAQGAGAAAPRVVVTAVLRDCYEGRRMASLMSLVMMVFMAVPILAPGVGQLVLLAADWRTVFWVLTLYGALLLAVIAARLPETLPPEWRRPLDPRSLLQSIGMALGARQTVGYALASGLLFGALFGFINSAQQVLGELYALGPIFPLAFATIAGGMAAASFINARLVERMGMRRLSHGALLAFCLVAAALYAAALAGKPPFWLLMALLIAAMTLVGMIFSNFNALAMEPQARAAGVASSLIGGATTLLGALSGYLTGAHYDGTVQPLALGYLLSGLLSLAMVLATEKGRLFGTGPGRG